MLGFKAFSTATVILAGIEMVQMMRKRQGRFAFYPAPFSEGTVRGLRGLNCVKQEADLRPHQILQHNPLARRECQGRRRERSL